eukprot:CAMPEP_0206053620 /NCGR_PEP_ID=MMETSP1466-20131121/36233_1 /ASSEMBLY_ACC=CAM_ASM_001126 /TAXON_ID=44452 /ORGANISM="Pavlova gyrans, Strain CCMP608" /LENGTH=49 /DNA_ID=CAMNT_0053428799 /DNA_START=500 /DNA_END=652 /DNA_ORIENTATION=-
MRAAIIPTTGSPRAQATLMCIIKRPSSFFAQANAERMSAVGALECSMNR